MIQILCPLCRKKEFDFEIGEDLQGDGVWATNVEFIEHEQQNCDCVFTDEELDSIREKASNLYHENKPYFSYF